MRSFRYEPTQGLIPLTEDKYPSTGKDELIGQLTQANPSTNLMFLFVVELSES